MAKQSQTGNKLAGLNKAWKGAQPKTGFSPLEDGEYDCRIDSATIEEAKSTKRLQVKWALTVVAPAEASGRKLWKYDGLDSQENLEWLKGGLETLELEIPEDITELPELLDGCAGLGIRVALRTKDEYQNVYFNEKVDLESLGVEAEAGSEGEETTPEETTEAAPFNEGDRVIVELDGTKYAGAVGSVDTDEGTAHVNFDDGDEGYFSFDDLSPEPKKTAGQKTGKTPAGKTGKTGKKTGKK